MAAATQSEQLENLGSIEALHPSTDHNSNAPSLRSVQKKRGPLNRFINSEIGRLIASLVFFVVICIFMAFCNQFSDHRWVTTSYTDIILKDRGFDIFPALKSDTSANTFVMTSIVFTVIGMFLICPTWTARAIVVRRVFWVVGALSAYRALTLSVTTMPTPKENCVPATATGFGPMFWIALQMIPGTVEACTDDIFSGHTVFMVTCAIQWRLYCKSKWVTYLSYIYITVGLYFVIATRLHYTVDVVLAVFITYTAWTLYIVTIDSVMEKEYFGLRRQRDKYAAFDGRWAEKDNQNPSTSEDPEKDSTVISASPQTGFAARRAQLEYRMNRLRGPGMGYDRGEHDHVAFVPMQYNIWIIGLIRWCDGLDIRMRSFDDDCSVSRWEELVINRQSTQKNQNSSSYQKAEIESLDESQGAPVMLQGVQVVSYSEGNSSGAGTK
ncbi:hypothetical protein BGZ46_002774 [Entomortierella lignicola]|nr:hypothetical protein BGZ46_002774 [Entomortierella lignicola]